MRQILTILSLALCLTSSAKTIFTIGDSTMATKNLEGNNQERGWGQMLPAHFDDSLKFENHARNGRSSKSFIDEGLWEKVYNKIEPGDYVIIQFGHNDEKADSARHTDAETSFADNLRMFVNQTREKGGIPVICNSIVRRNFSTSGDAVAADDFRKAELEKQENEQDSLVDTHGKYRDVPRQVAKEMDVRFIDMNRMTHKMVSDLGREKSKEMFMWIDKGVCPACPDGRQDNTHLNVSGARNVARQVADSLVNIFPELASHKRTVDFVVAQDGSGDFFTVQEAVNAVPNFRKNHRTTILIRKGEYRENVIVAPCKINLSIIGEDSVTIVNNGYASKNNSLGDEMSTSGSATCYIYGNDFYAENITFVNDAGRVGQAVACFVDGDRAHFRRCRFLGNQDTLYTYGKNSRQYYENCYIEGTVDFIFGWSTVIFDHCHIHSVGDGYLTAPSTPEGKAFGYVFFNCKLTADDGVEKVYLSRPWRPFAKAAYINCEIGKHILPAGWDNWKNPENEKTVEYSEYGNTGEGASTKKRVSYAHQLKNIDKYTMENIFAGEDVWMPKKEE